MWRRAIWLIGVVFAGCGRPQSVVTPSPAPPGALRFLALGDSYTIGQSVDDSQRWPVQLVAALQARGLIVGELRIIARTGWTTADLSDAMNASDLHGPYDLVGLLIGVNNQYQGRSTEEYRQQFSDLLSRSIALAGGKPNHVIVLSIPDWGVTPYARDGGFVASDVTNAIDQFNAINKEITLSAGAAYVDITPLSRQHPEMVADDGLHPNGAMYAKWVEFMMPAAQKALRP